VDTYAKNSQMVDVNLGGETGNQLEDMLIIVKRNMIKYRATLHLFQMKKKLDAKFTDKKTVKNSLWQDIADDLN
jgi:hypothetical protein